MPFVIPAPIEVLPDVLAGHYRNADPYFAKALLAASIAYKKDILECATPEEVEWTKNTTQSTLGETHILRCREPKMDEPIPLYDRNPLWNLKFCGYRHPTKTSRDLIITGHHNGPNKYAIPDSYCPYFRTHLLHPWLIPWGFTPYGTHIHKGWFRPKLR